MQITFSAEHLDAIRKIAEPAAIPALIWAYKRLKTKLNGIITENVNRVRDELMTHLNKRMDDHERVETANLQEIRKLLSIRT